MSAGSWLELGDDERQLFLAEGAELLEQLEAGLLDLEAGRGGPETVHAVFRAAHTLKGSAATVGLDGMARLTHAMESRLDAWRHGQGEPEAGEVAAMLAGVDRLRAMLAAVAAGGDPPPPPAELLATLEAPATAPADAWVVEAELDPDCPMPAVRALQVLLALEDRAPLLASEPARDGLEATWSGRSVRARVAAEASAADLEAAVAAVPDVVAVRVRRASGGDAPRGGPAEGGAATEAAPGVGAAPTAPAAGRDAAGLPAAAAAAPTDDRTVPADASRIAG
ncbi:MAG: chemotaxis protein CheA, partial [Bacillota bacterium]